MPRFLHATHSAFSNKAVLLIVLVAYINCVVIAFAPQDIQQLMAIYGTTTQRANIIQCATETLPAGATDNLSVFTKATASLVSVCPYVHQDDQAEAISMVRDLLKTKRTNVCYIIDNLWEYVLLWENTQHAESLIDALTLGHTSPVQCSLDTSLFYRVLHAIKHGYSKVAAAMLNNSRFAVSRVALCAFLPWSPLTSQVHRAILGSMDDAEILLLDIVPWISIELRTALWQFKQQENRQRQLSPIDLQIKAILQPHDTQANGQSPQFTSQTSSIAAQGIDMTTHFEPRLHQGVNAHTAIVRIVMDYVNADNPNSDQTISMNATISVLSSVSQFYAIKCLCLIAFAYRSTKLLEYMQRLSFYRPHHMAHMMHLAIRKGKWEIVGTIATYDLEGTLADAFPGSHTGVVLEIETRGHRAVIEELENANVDSSYNVAGIAFGQAMLNGFTHSGSFLFTEFLHLPGYWGVLANTLVWAHDRLGPLFRSTHSLSVVCLMATVLHSYATLRDQPLNAVMAVVAYMVLSPVSYITPFTLYVLAAMPEVTIEQWQNATSALNTPFFMQSLYEQSMELAASRSSHVA